MSHEAKQMTKNVASNNEESKFKFSGMSLEMAHKLDLLAIRAGTQAGLACCCEIDIFT